MMFTCETTFTCDICRNGFSWKRMKMTLCPSHLSCQDIFKEKGWKVVYGKYDVCKECIQHYGIKEVRKMLKEREKK